MDISGDFTRRILRSIGIKKGAAVLDFGCGAGAVTFELAKIVGSEGSVTGVDSGPESIENARAEAEARGVANVKFRQIDLTALPEDLGRYDAMFGRRVLMYLPNPLEAVKALSEHLKPGGVFIAHEHDFAFRYSGNHDHPAFDRGRDLAQAMLEHEGAQTRLGPKLFEMFDEAGLTRRNARTAVLTHTPDNPYPLADMLRMSKSRIDAASLLSRQEYEELLERLEKEQSIEGIYLADLMFGVWGYKD
ncbi:class I SAM-dependent methyltransferase [Erythrobacter sp. A6_0]|uniref:class I SAM-dependent methyltransferase n=1 Tax=Erythrobacter sp. A6_0 TaxID=2821089 RepID=UPI001ADB6983|nr:class I SAM-dependent methyltransferase [Erythrobacter sp. A6_0]